MSGAGVLGHQEQGRLWESRRVALCRPSQLALSCLQSPALVGSAAGSASSFRCPWFSSQLPPPWPPACPGSLELLRRGEVRVRRLQQPVRMEWAHVLVAAGLSLCPSVLSPEHQLGEPSPRVWCVLCLLLWLLLLGISSSQAWKLPVPGSNFAGSFVLLGAPGAGQSSAGRLCLDERDTGCPVSRRSCL